MPRIVCLLAATGAALALSPVLASAGLPILNRAPACDAAQMTVLAGHTGAVTVNCTDADGDALTYAVASGPAHGTASISSDGVLTVHAATSYAGTDTVTFRASDGQASSAAATLSITVNAQHAPACPSATLVVKTDHSASDTMRCTDVDGDTLSYALVSDGQHGHATVSSGGALTYTPATGYQGDDALTLSAADGAGATTSFSVSVGVHDDRAPVCDDQTVQASGDTSTSFMTGCSDPDDGRYDATYRVVSGPAHGTVSSYSLDTVTYTPQSGYRGSDTLTFQATDSSGLVSNVATLHISVVDPAAPHCTETMGPGDDTTAEDDADGYTVRLSCGPGNDGPPIAFVIDTPPAHGTLTPQPQTSDYSRDFVYRPTGGYRGPESFTWHGEGPTHHPSASRTWSFTVVDVPTNHAPDACSGLAYRERVHAGKVLHLTASCYDQDHDALAATVVTPPAHGTLTTTDGPSGTSLPVTYTPAAGFDGRDTFAITLSDGRGGVSPVLSGDVIVEPTDYNRPPGMCFTPAPADERIEVDQTKDIDRLCADADNDELTYRITGQPLHGTLTAIPGGFRYTPDTGFTGHDSFLYKASDGYAEIREQQYPISVGVGHEDGQPAPRTGEAGGVQPTGPFANVGDPYDPDRGTYGPGGGGGGGGGTATKTTTEPSATTPAPTPAFTPATPGTPARPATAPAAPATTARSAGLELGAASAFLAPEVQKGVVAVGSGPSVPVVSLSCLDACTAHQTADLVLTGAHGRSAGAAASRRIRLATKDLHLRAGRARSVTVPFTRATRKALRAAKTAKLMVTLKVRHADGKVRTDTLTLRVRPTR